MCFLKRSKNLVDQFPNRIIQPDNVVLWRNYRKRWKSIIIHHTAAPKIGEPGTLYHDRIDRYHRYIKFWRRGFGYHFLINPGGEIQVSQRWVKQLDGAHVKGHNRDTIGIAIVGNFDEHDITGLPLDSLIELCAVLINHLRLSPPYPILPHSVFTTKTCPGLQFNIDELQRNVVQRIFSY